MIELYLLKQSLHIVVCAHEYLMNDLLYIQLPHYTFSEEQKIVLKIIFNMTKMFF